MAPRRVLVVLESLRAGGAERLVVTTLARLDRTRFEAQVAILFAPDDLAGEVERLGVTVHRLGLARATELAAAAWRLRELVRRERIHLVHSHLVLANLASRLAVLRSVPVVATLHNPDYTFEANRSLRFWIRKRLDAATLAWTRPALLAVSDAVRADYEKHFGARGIRVLPNYADVAELERRLGQVDRQAARRALGVAPHEVAVLHVGRFHRQKGQDLLLRAFAEARREHAGLRLVLAGEGSTLASCRALSGELDIADAVTFAGPVADPVPLYRAADVFAFPSRYEAFGIALLEAMGAGLPAVVTRTGGIPELATPDSALFVGVERVGELAAALARLAGDPGLRAGMGAAGRERAQAFDVGPGVAELERIYDEILARWAA